MNGAMGVTTEWAVASGQLPVGSEQLAGAGRHSKAGMGIVITTAVIVGVVFFAAGHDFLISRAVAYTQTAEEMQAAALGGNFARRAAFFALGGWGVVLLAVGGQRLKVDWALLGGMGAVLALGIASVLWSDEPAMSIRRLLVLVCCATAAAGVAKMFSLREIGWLIIVVIGPLAAMGIAAELFLGTFRPWASDYRFAGTVHPNTQGPALATLCLAALALAKNGGRYRSLLWFVFAAGAVLLLLTKSRTTAGSLVGAIAAVQIVKLPLRTQMIWGVLAVWLAVGGIWAFSVSGLDSAADFREFILLGRSDESESLSGRALIWPEVIQYARERFWLGYGYEAFWTPARIEVISEEVGWGVREAHNGYLEMWLWLGAIGVVMTMAAASAAVVAAVRSFRASNDSAYLLPLGLLVFSIFDSCLESGVVVVSLVPFLLGCGLMRLALFGEAATSIAGSKLVPVVSQDDAALTTSGSRLAPG